MNKSNNMKKNIIWNSIGVLSVSLTSFIYTLVLVRICGLSVSGIWSYFFALACTSVTLASFGGRTYQVTDVKNKIPTYIYVSARYFTVILTFILMIVFSFIKGFNSTEIITLLLLCIFKYCEELSDVYYGILQKKDYLYIVGKSMFIKSLLNVLVFFIVTLLYKNLLLSICSILLVNLLVLIFYDRKNALKYEKINYVEHAKKYYLKYIKNNLIICLVLFLAMFLVNCPKYVMGNYLSDEIQGIFNILLVPATAVSLIGSFIINPVLVNISIDYANNNIKQVKKNSKKIILTILGFGIFTGIAGYIVGPILYKIIYNFELTAYMREFIIMIGGCTFYVISSILSMILITMRKINEQLIYNVILSIISYILCLFLVKNYGISGGVYAYTIIMLVRCLIYIFMLFTVKE